VDQKLEVRIGYAIRARVGRQQGQILYIARSGSAQPHLISTQKYAVLECLNALEMIGYNFPIYSTMRMGALDVGLHHDIGTYCASIADNNMNDVVSLITYIQIHCYVYICAWF
jgi:hypothetical protein